MRLLSLEALVTWEIRTDFLMANRKDLEINIEPKTKAKIEAAVESYSKLFPLEYKNVIAQVNKKKWLLDDERFGESQTGNMRALYEIPETLFSTILQVLTSGEMEEFKGQKGSRWFAKKFPQFRTAQEV